MHPLFQMAQIIAVRGWSALRRRGRLCAALCLTALLAACSAFQLGYNQAHTALYWWVDGYADLDDTQSTQVRQAIDRMLVWHRQNELPAYADRLQQWQALALQDLSGRQVCAQVEHLRAATERLFDRSHEPLAQLALSLSPAQLQHLERHQNKRNVSFEKDFLRGNAAQRLERRLDRAVDRYETLYGSLTPQQVQQVRNHLEDSPFDASRSLADRRARQAELLTLIRQLQGSQPRPPAADSPVPSIAAQALRDWLQRGLLASPDTDSERAGWIRHGCERFAQLHNSTSVAQREHAQQLLIRYEKDLRALSAQAGQS